MAKYTIYPLLMGFNEFDISFFILKASGSRRKMSLGCILLKDNETGELTLLDTAFPTREQVIENDLPYNYVLEAEGYKTLPEALAEVGAEPGDISRICLSHLHSDHAWNLELFRKDIPIYVQKRELEHAINPYPIEKKSYQIIDRPMCPGWIRGLTRFVVIDGDYQITPGLKALLTPGHTVGSQSFLIDTEKGQYIYVGDHCYAEENWKENIPTGWFYAQDMWFDSMDKIRATGAEILSVHCTSTFDQKVYE